MELTIRKAMESITTNRILLPAIQRKFIWSSKQIEMLFDSILRGYPINTLMMWKILDENLKVNYKFYSFIKDYTQRFHEDNDDVSTQFMSQDFYAVIDGQQRLTSIYIGLVGTYREKKPYLWWNDSEEAMPTKQLYIELTTELDPEIDNEQQYNFSFMSTDDLESDIKRNPNHCWFKVGDILHFKNIGEVLDYINENNLSGNKFAVATISKLFTLLDDKDILKIIEIDDQDQDRVLEIFIRTNSGGTPLSFSDLLMSIASANWTEFDAREEINSVIKAIYKYGNPKFYVSKDFVLKSILVLSDVDVSFKIKNFGRDNISIFEQKWSEIKKSLIATFELLEQIGYNDILLRSKNAAIVIAYYIYKNNLADTIVKPIYSANEKSVISKWLAMSLLKGIFGRNSDSVLKDLRSIIYASAKPEFPFEDIVEHFKDDVNRNFVFTDEVLNSFLEEQYGSPVCGLVLSLLYQNVILKNGNHIAEDHMHPVVNFSDKDRLEALHLNDDMHSFYVDKRNYNSVLNLQLLEELTNKSKNDTSLSIWAEKYGANNRDLYVDDTTSLDIIDFKEFIESRRKNLLAKLKEILSV